LEWAAPFIEFQKCKLVQAENGTDHREPHALHVIYRVKPLNGRPWWEKKIMAELGLDGPSPSHPVIHKNTPSINKKLSHVKHLVKIQELKFPHGIPEDPSDFEYTQIKSNGEMVVVKQLTPSKSLSEKEVDHRAKWRLQEDTVERANKRILDRYAVHTEYVESFYEYKRNQDGKEYRYNFNKSDSGKI
jgi:large subunit ribosomal protein L30